MKKRLTKVNKCGMIIIQTRETFLEYIQKGVIIIMTKEAKIALMEDRIQKLTNNKKDNARIVKKLRRKITRM